MKGANARKQTIFASWEMSLLKGATLARLPVIKTDEWPRVRNKWQLAVVATTRKNVLNEAAGK